MASLTTTYWCHQCARFVRTWAHNGAVSCPHCESGFIEEVPVDTPLPDIPSPRLRFPFGHAASHSDRSGNIRRRRRPATGERSPYNPVIVLRGPTSESDSDSNTFELYYDDGNGAGLRPLPASMSDFLMGSGLDRLLEQLAQMEIAGLGRPENPAASKAAVESLPWIEIGPDQTGSELHCAVCKDAFELGAEAREMPCKHLYHSDCILPWLSTRNSCPVCRHELPADPNPVNGSNQGGGDEEPIGLTIWRLPGGGFAVGRFRRGAARELPGVYTEMDGGGFGGRSNGTPRSVSWGSRSHGRQRSGIAARIFRNLFSFLGRSRPATITNPSSAVDSDSIRRSWSIGRSRGNRRNQTWVIED
ncbi:hypothetical protein SAY87_016316 [Trapa incisa]|uniref:RING-type E3 ubiquitin transferase n=1 Tax=Trapa incisa TaxID=236973 RepID=A0AAN7L8C2_9MYRT|nr:hypothetical protein SAY87_016316 [Trapa incisa]